MESDFLNFELAVDNRYDKCVFGLKFFYVFYNFFDCWMWVEILGMFSYW